ncbi:MAG: flagellar basal body rod C-terminal domain-containing protein [Acidimicrobiales bacterium]
MTPCSAAPPPTTCSTSDVLLDKIARLTTITTSQGKDGVTNVYVGSFPLVDGITAQEIVVPQTGGPVWGINGYPVDLSGELAAVHEGQTVTLPAIQASLDEIASALRTVVNSQHAAGTDLENNPGGDFFVGTTAADIQVNTALTPAQVAAGQSSAPADNRNALLMARLGGQEIPGVGTVDRLTATLAGRLGESAAATEQMSRVLTSSLATLQDQRESHMGVNLDEELSDLIRYQRAYEASARVMQVADEMLDRLINRTGV